MLKPFKRPGSDNWWLKKRVGKDIVEQARGQTFEVVFPAHDNFPEHTAKAKFGDSVTCTLATTNRQLAQDRCHLANIEYSKCRDRLVNKATIRSDPAITSLAQTLFDYFNDEHANADVPIKYDWLSVDGITQASAELGQPGLFIFLGDQNFNGDRRYALQPYHHERYPDDDKSLKAMESRYGVICNWALCYKKILINDSSRYQMLCDFESFLNQARIEQSNRKAAIRDRNTSENVVTRKVTFTEIYDEWVRIEKPSFNSKKSWKSVLKNLVIFLDHDDAVKVSSFDIERWRDTFTPESKPSITTAQTSHFPCVRRMYSFGIEAKKLTFNPTSGIKISLKDVEKEDVAPYTNPDMEKIITAARLQDKPFIKWIPILMAVTGARPGEIAQLGYDQIKCDVNTKIWFIDIRPSEDGGYVKTKSSRRLVPIHRGILDELLAFKETRKDMPLFYDVKHTKKSLMHPGQGLVGRMAPWYRTHGIDMKGKSPNHSIRHWWKSEAFRAKVDSELADKIQGHAKKDTAKRYRHFDLQQFRDAIESMSIPTISIPADVEHSAEATP